MRTPALIVWLLLATPGVASAQSPQSFRPAPIAAGHGDTASVAEAETEAAALGRAGVIAGVETYSELMSDYAGTPTYGAGRAVGRLLKEQADGGMSQGSAFERCTAWLVGPDVVMTARHCLPEAVGSNAVNVNVQFGFQIETGVDGRARNSAPYRIGEILEADDALDYLLARVIVAADQPRPGDIFGVIRVAKDGGIRHGEPLQVIHHPFGFSQLIIKDGTCRAIAYAGGEPAYLYHRCDTWSGSSGAPVLSYLPGWLPATRQRTEVVAVGLHRAGQELTNDNSVNIAVRLPQIVKASAYLEPVACSFAPEGWRCPSLDRPAGRTYRFAYDRAAPLPAMQPGPTGPIPTNEVRALINGIRSDIASASDFVRIRIYADATLDEPFYPAGTPVATRSRMREAFASTRASALWGLLMNSNVLPSPSSGVAWIVEMDYSRPDPGGQPGRPNERTAEVFIDYMP